MKNNSANIITTALLLLSVNYAHANGNHIICGPEPQEPRAWVCDSPGTSIVQKLDCLHHYDIEKMHYELDLNQWRLCTMAYTPPVYESPDYSPEKPEPVLVRIDDVEVCTELDITYYGNRWLRGDRLPPSGIYGPGDYGLFCDDVFVPKTHNKYYYYEDYDGAMCEVYMDQISSIETLKKCEIVQVKIYAYP